MKERNEIYYSHSLLYKDLYYKILCMNFCNKAHTFYLACRLNKNSLIQSLRNKIEHALTKMKRKEKKKKRMQGCPVSQWNQGSSWVTLPYTVLWCASSGRFFCFCKCCGLYLLLMDYSDNKIIYFLTFCNFSVIWEHNPQLTTLHLR
jgi:hypothetical protein